MNLSIPEYSVVLNAIGDCVMLIDATSYLILDINPKCLALLGMERDEVVGQPCYKITHAFSAPCGFPNDPCPISIAVKTKKSTTVTHKHHVKGGGRRNVEITALPLMDASGEVERIIHISKDITEVVLLNEDLFHARKLEAVGKVAAGIAHDVNNAIGAIAGYVSLILKDLPADSPLREDLLEIKRAEERASAIVKELMAACRKRTLQKKLLDLNLLISGFKRILEGTVGPAIQVIFNPAPEVKDIYADASQLEDCLLNLAVNAKDAMPGGGCLTISTFMERDFVRTATGDENIFYPAQLSGILVEDTGAGIPEKDLKNIFEPFFTTKAEGKGTGLGLANVFCTVNQHQGRIKVSSTVGKGTAFRITFPVVQNRNY